MTDVVDAHTDAAMAERDRRSGMGLAFAAAASAALGIVPYKLATRDAAPEDIVVVLLLAAAIVNSAITAVSLHRDRGRPDVGARPLRRIGIWVALWMGVLAAAANYASGQGVAQLDASVSTLLIQMQVLMAAVLGWAWIGEKVTTRFVVGACVAILGVAAIPEGGEAGASVTGVIWTLGAAACFGTMQVLTRRYIHRIDIMWVNALRLWVATALVAAVPGSLAGALALDGRILVLAALSGLLGPVVSRLMMMMSARHLPAATTTVIGLSSPVIALAADALVLDGVPTARAWIGGIVVAVGLLIAIRRPAIVPTIRLPTG